MKASAIIRSGGILLVLGALISAGPSRSSGAQDVVRDGGLIRVRTDDVPAKPNLDPAVRSWVFAAGQVFEGLVRLSGGLDFTPALADYWVVSEDGRRTTFLLKRGVRFHNGREMDSQDVKFSFERLLRREIASPIAPYLAARVIGAQEFWEGRAEDVSGFRAPEKFLFEVQWKTPSPASLILLSTSFCMVLPRDLVLDQGHDFFAKPVGTGPFRFGYWIRSPRLDIVGVRLERNPQYYARRPYLDAIEFSPFFTLDQFRDGDVDILPFLSERQASAGAQVVQGGLYNMTFLMMSCRNAPFDRAAARKAVAAALDKDKLAAALAGPAVAPRSSGNFIPPGLPGFVPVDERLAADPEKAKQLLVDLGFLIEKKFPDIILYLMMPRSETSARLSRELESQLDAVGIPSTVRYIRSTAELRDVKQPFLAVVPWRMDFPDAENIIQPLFTSASEINRSAFGYSSAALDKLFEEAETEKSWNRRVELFRRMEGLLLQDVPAIPLFFSEERFAVQSRIHGIKIPPLGFQFIDGRSIWTEKKGQTP